MNVYPIVNSTDIHWNIFSDEIKGFAHNDGTPFFIAAVLNEVRRVFIDTFGEDTVNSHPILGVLHSNDNPQTQRENALIFLTSTGAHYQQHIYQFSHELCHFMISKNVCNTYRWFEETLCQMMSWYAMQKIYESPEDLRITPLRNLYDGIPMYIKQDQMKRYEIRGNSLSEYINSNLPYLQGEPYDRSMNSAVAYEIYPLFLKNPVLWRIVPFLDRVQDGTSLVDLINSTSFEAGVPKTAWEQLSNQLFN